MGTLGRALITGASVGIGAALAMKLTRSAIGCATAAGQTAVTSSG